MEVLNKLFNKADQITPENCKLNHYLFNAYKQNLTNYRIVNFGTLFKDGLLYDLPEYAVKFVSTHQQVIMIASFIKDKIVFAYLRALNQKALVFVGNAGLMYGLGSLPSSFKFGDPVLLVEGPLDRDAIIDIYPNTISTLSADISVFQMEVLETLTNNYLLMFDNDKGGREGTYRVKKNMNAKGLKVTVVPSYALAKDPGTRAEYLFKGDQYNFTTMTDMLDANLKILSLT